MSKALVFFEALCEIGTGLERARDRHAPGSDDWTILTELLGQLDVAVDALVHSTGLGGADDA
jgi:hypothetical protein